MMCTRYRVAAGVALAATIALVSASCGEVVREGRSPAYLVIDNLQGASGAEPDKLQHTLESDVVTAGSIYEDSGVVEAHIAMKDIGTPDRPTEPSSNNLITLDRYHVRYIRSDGRETPGVDVPYPFDGAATATLGKSPSEVSFILVRAQAKLEAPLRTLQGTGGALVISTIAEVTFYGRDQAGNAVSVTGRIGVNFADWGDPQ